MVTKNRGPVPLAKHLEAVHGHGRAPTAPVLGAFGRRSDEEIEVVAETEVVEEEDDNDEHEVVRVHAKTRRCFFTPVRVQGAPPAKAVTASRLMVGSFVDMGEVFRVCDC